MRLRYALCLLTLVSAVASVRARAEPPPRIAEHCILEEGLPPSGIAQACEDCRNRLGDLSRLEKAYLDSICPPEDTRAIEDADNYQEPKVRGFSVYLDNDVLFKPLNDDQNYTMGLTFRLAGSWVPDCVRGPLLGLDRFFGTYRGHESARLNTVHDFSLGHTAFTPEDLRSEELIPDDRPYASMLFVTVRRSSGPAQGITTGDDAITVAYKSELTIGVLGLRIGERFQTWWHDVLRGPSEDSPPEPKGWANQISDGGEPTLLYRAQILKRFSGSNRHDVTGSAEGSLGYYTNAGAGVAARVGRLDTPFWSFEASPQDSYAQALPTKKSEAYLFAAARVRAWAYNVFLQGQFRQDQTPVRYSGSEIERVVWDFSVGGALTLPRLWRIPRCNVTYVVSGRSPEFSSAGARSHFWGGAYLSFLFGDGSR